MKSFLSKIFIVAALFMAVLPVSAQQMEEPKSLLSPNVATLGTFREPEVSLFTGTPSISIPLFEVPLQDYVLPIELQYNGTSILVDQPPSWVGLGWNLSAGGVITRKMNDVPDDHRFTEEFYRPLQGDSFIDFYRIGYYFRYQALDTPAWSSFKVHKFTDTDTIFYPIAYDYEPDEFSFVFAGHRGSFYLNHKGEWEVKCDKSIRVQLISDFISPPFFVPEDLYCSPLKKQPSCFSGFIITTEDGTQYVFGNDVNAIDFYTNFFGTVQIMIANAWHLTKIILPNKQEMTFSYQRQQFTNQMYYALITSVFNKPNYGIFYPPCGVFSSIFDSWEHINGKLLSPVYLRKIETPTLSVVFSNSVANDLQYKDSAYLSHLEDYYNSSFIPEQRHCSYMPYLVNHMSANNLILGVQQYLDSIHHNLKRYKLDSVVFISGNLQKKISFNYIENSTTRLALSDIIYADNTRYHFKYDNLQYLPEYLSFRTDHWGYYNNNNSIIHNHLDTIDYYLKMEPSSRFSKYGLLKAVYHPTGGVTKFEYESNDYQKQVKECRWAPLDEYDEKRYGGGVRIRKISHFEEVNDDQPAISKEYFYTTNYIFNPNSNESSGILGERFKYSFEYYEDVTPMGMAYRKVFSAVSVLPNYGGDASICYSEVTEKLSSGGYTVYMFSNYSDYLDEKPIAVKQEAQEPYGKFSSRKMNRGLLLSKTEYDNQKQILHKTEYNYIPNKPNDSFVRSLNWYRLFCSGYGQVLDEGASYKFYTHTMVPETIRDVWYSANGDSIVKTTKNYYNLQYQMPTQIDVMTKTDTISQTIKYPFDLHPWGIRPYRPYSNDFDRLCAKMKSEHYFLPLEVSNYKRGKVVNSTYYNYSEHNGLGQETYYAVDSVSTLGITEPLANFTPVSLFHKDDRYIVPAKQSCKYDAYGNIAEITTDGVPVSYIWGYNHAYVVAKVIGINEAQVLNILSANQYIQFNSPTGPTLANLTSFQASVNATYPQAQCYTYQYNPLYGIISETDPKGQTLFYDYDAMGRLKEVYYKENDTKRVVKKYLYHHKHFESIQPL